MKLRPGSTRFFALVALMLLATHPASAQTTSIRILASNLTSGNFQSYQAPGNRLLQGLDPDIVLIQEFSIFVNSGDTANQTTPVTNQWVLDNFGAGFVWFREPGSEQIPNGVISRWPLLQTGQVDNPFVPNRDTAYARIDIPGAIDLWVFSCHFSTSPSSEQSGQAQNIVNFINANVPAGEYIIVGGDFNGTAALSNLSAKVVTAAPFPADHNGNINTNANRNSHYDYVLADPNFDSLEQTISLGSADYANGLVFDSRVFTPLTAVSPVQAGDSGVSGMQHMAVLRDFVVNSAADDFSVAPLAVDFGTRDATTGPFTDQSVLITVTNPFQLTGVIFSGAFAAEFALFSPDLSGGPAAITADTNLQFRWTPPANDQLLRNVTANFTTNGSPAAFQLELNGATIEAPPGESTDAARWQLY